ncbi:amidohydrolase family protein [Amycolatopsis sp. NPDC059090]|uniref:amidohydrolase family protein n=1 Tax=Amycolatopsis sp. NPDC059090 TaxID=3346723 RepID=UPI00366F9053
MPEGVLVVIAVDLVVRAAYVLTMTEGASPLRGGAIAVDAGRVVRVGTAQSIDAQYLAKRTVDVGNAVVLPGFVDVHAHVSQTFLRGRQNGVFGAGPFLPFLVTDLLTDDRVRLFGLAGCLEALRYGTTTIQASLTSMPALAEAVELCGIRAVLAEEVCDMSYEDAAYGRYVHRPGQADVQLDRARLLVEDWHRSASGRIIAAVAPLAPDMVLPGTYRQIARFAHEYGVMVATHAAQSKFEMQRVAEIQGTTPIRYLSDLGTLGDMTLLAHCLYATAEDVAIVAEAGAAVAHSPRGFLLDGVVAPLSDWLSSGIRVGLGTDDVTHSMWETLRAARYAAAVRGDRSITPYQMLELATLGGAAALGLSGEVGAIAPDLKADLQVVGCDGPEMTPMSDVAGSLVENGGANVNMVFVDGKIVFGPGRETKIDIPRSLDDVREENGRLWLDIAAKFGPELSIDQSR